MGSTATSNAIASPKILLWRLVSDQDALTQDVINHPYPGSGTHGDPFIISWIPNDPCNPMLFSDPSKWTITLLIALTSMALALVASAYSGSSREVIQDLQISEEVSILGISLFVVGFAIGPLFWAPLSEIYGRRVVYLTSCFFLTTFTACSACAKNPETLIILRFFSGSLGSAPMAIPGGVIADTFPPVSRGLAGGIFAVAPGIGPTLGPIIGGFLAQAGGWRWVEWALATFCGTLLLAILLLLPETYAPVLLQRRAKALHKITGHIYQSELESGASSTLITFRIALSRPWLLLFREPIVFLLSLYTAIIYGILFMLFPAYPIVFQQTRGWTEGMGGLAFLGILVGIIIAVIYSFPMYFKYKRKALDAAPNRLPPEARLPDSFLGCIALPVGLFWFAWTNSPSIHWMVSIAAGVPFGFGMVMVFIPVSNYLVDAYTIFAASTLAANSLLRSLFGAVFPLFTTDMFQRLGIHWAASIPAFLALSCAPLPFVFYKYGALIRERSHYAAEADRVFARLLENIELNRPQTQKANTVSTEAELDEL